MTELERYKEYFVQKLKNKNIEEVFDRLHIIPQAKFKEERTKLAKNDSFINW